MKFNQKLFFELEKRFEEDQYLLNKNDIKGYNRNCNNNSKWLKK